MCENYKDKRMIKSNGSLHLERGDQISRLIQNLATLMDLYLSLMTQKLVATHWFSNTDSENGKIWCEIMSHNENIRT